MANRCLACGSRSLGRRRASMVSIFAVIRDSGKSAALGKAAWLRNRTGRETKRANGRMSMAARIVPLSENGRKGADFQHFAARLLFVIPAKAGIQLWHGAGRRSWIPAFAGMTERASARPDSPRRETPIRTGRIEAEPVPGRVAKPRLAP